MATVRHRPRIGIRTKYRVSFARTARARGASSTQPIASRTGEALLVFHEIAVLGRQHEGHSFRQCTLLRPRSQVRIVHLRNACWDARALAPPSVVELLAERRH